MTGMLRALISERADAAGSPELDIHELIAQGERRITTVVAWPRPALRLPWR